MRIIAATLALAAFMAWGIKQHYAAAAADDLWWILAPTAKLVSVVTGASFTMQPGEGYLSRERLFLIEKSCAGVNFLIAAFAMLVLTRVSRVSSALAAAGLISVSLIASYAAAVAINASRIVLAMWLARHSAALPLSAADVHRIEGVVVYFAGLVLLYETARYVQRHALAVRQRPGGVGVLR